MIKFRDIFKPKSNIKIKFTGSKPYPVKNYYYVPNYDIHSIHDLSNNHIGDLKVIGYNKDRYYDDANNSENLNISLKTNENYNGNFKKLKNTNMGPQIAIGHHEVKHILHYIIKKYPKAKELQMERVTGIHSKADVSSSHSPIISVDLNKIRSKLKHK